MKLSKNTLKRVGAGQLIGAVNGLFGGGGGMVAVPLLKNMLGFEDRRAHATAILIIAPVCAVSALTYVINGYFSAQLVIPTAIGSVIGGIVGAQLLNKLPEKLINAVFVAVMLVAGVRMLF